jgi:hypothetical protein
MPRYRDPDRIRRAAQAYIDGECERGAAIERAGCGPHLFGRVVAELRAKKIGENNQSVGE